MILINLCADNYNFINLNLKIAFIHSYVYVCACHDTCVIRGQYVSVLYHVGFGNGSQVASLGSMHPYH